MPNLKIAIVFIFSFLIIGQSYAASTTANATATVIAAIAITKTADLAFGTAPQSDPAKVILPASVSAASFTVTGAPNTAYTVTLPADGTVTMITGTGAVANQKIAVNTFTSTPAAGANGMLSAAGTQTLKVGATRAALLATQVVGSYTAAFTVNVVY